MLDVLWQQLRHRRGRSLTLAAGILVAAVSFSLLTAAASTGTARVKNTVNHNFRAAYDILVRPPGSNTELERSAGLVQQNYLSGIFGGISIRQWHKIERVPGVAVAAPIAMIGYVLPFVNFPIDLTDRLSAQSRQIFRIEPTWSAENGLSRFAEPPSYVYVTRHPVVGTGSGDAEVAGDLPQGRAQTCTNMVSNLPVATSAFSVGARTGIYCWTTASQSQHSGYGLPRGHVGGRISWAFPFLLAAVDPDQEEKLVGLSSAVSAGRYLTETDGPHVVATEGLGHPTVPVLAATMPFIDDSLHVQVQRLDLTPQQLAQISRSPSFLKRLATVGGKTVERSDTGTADAYSRLVGRPLQVGSYWTSSTVHYRRLGPTSVTPTLVKNPASVWFGHIQQIFPAPLDNADTAFRQLAAHAATGVIAGGAVHLAYLKVVGQLDPARIRGFNPLTRVPLSTYNPPDAPGADRRSQRLLGGKPLSPDANIAGYLQPPPLLLTTIRGMSLMHQSSFYDHASTAAPISVIRIRVGGLHGSTRARLQQIGQVALAIKRSTGLQVDVTAGSSPTRVHVELPPGHFGRPPLTLDEPWVKKGVAVAVLTAVDRKSAALFALILLVTACFLANGAFAAVRARRHEIGVLRCLGWPRHTIFWLVLGELVILGLLAGLAGAGISALVILLSGFDLPLLRVLLVPPVAVALAVLAGLVPAWRAGRGQPLDAVAPAVMMVRRARAVRRPVAMGLSNLRRMPGRAALAAVALAVGVAALSVLLAIQLSFGHDIAGSALGGFVTSQVRGVDYFSAALAIALGGASVADVLYLNLRERAPEFAVLAATGWRQRHLVRVGWAEGIAIGVIGSAVGVCAGIAVTVALGTPVGDVAVAAIIAGLGGLVVVLATARLVLLMVQRIPIAAVLAEA